MEDSLQNQGTNTATSPAPIQSPSPGPNRHDPIQSGSGNKKPQGASSDRVQYLGDMSSFQLFSNKIQLDDTNTKWKGHHIRKFGKQVVLIEDGKEDEENQTKIPEPQLLPHVKPIHYWIYSVTGVDRHTSDRLIKM